MMNEYEKALIDWRPASESDDFLDAAFAAGWNARGLEDIAAAYTHLASRTNASLQERVDVAAAIAKLDASEVTA